MKPPLVEITLAHEYPAQVLKVKPPLVEITLAHKYSAQVVGTESETSTGRNYASPKLLSTGTDISVSRNDNGARLLSTVVIKWHLLIQHGY